VADTQITQLRRPGCPASASTRWEESILARILAAVRSMRAASIAAPKPLSICRQAAMWCHCMRNHHSHIHDKQQQANIRRPKTLYMHRVVSAVDLFRSHFMTLIEQRLRE